MEVDETRTFDEQPAEGDRTVEPGVEILETHTVEQESDRQPLPRTDDHPGYDGDK